MCRLAHHQNSGGGVTSWLCAGLLTTKIVVGSYQLAMCRLSHHHDIGGGVTSWLCAGLLTTKIVVGELPAGYVLACSPPKKWWGSYQLAMCRLSHHHDIGGGVTSWLCAGFLTTMILVGELPAGYVPACSPPK